jgi:hypothetical protein
MVTNSIHHTGCHQLNREPGFVDCKITLWKMVVSNPTLRKAQQEMDARRGVGGALPGAGTPGGGGGGGGDENANANDDENENDGRHVLGENNGTGRSPLGASAGRKKTPLARLGSLGEGEGGKESSKLYSHENGVVALRVGRSGGRGRGRVCLFSGTWYEKLSRSLLFCFRFPQPSRCDVHSGLPFPCYATLRRGASG